MERALIIDDDEELCELVTEYLAQQGFQVEAAHAGVLGVGQALKGDYAIVILDVMLPGIDGFETLRRIRAGQGMTSHHPRADADSAGRCSGSHCRFRNWRR